MRIKDLKAILDMMPENNLVLVRTNPSDYSQHLKQDMLTVVDIENEKSAFLITAFIPSEKK